MVNTVTSYRSPVRLVRHASEDVEPYSSQAISRTRKKMMAEISLGGDEIVLEDVPYSRNDASTLLDVITEDNWKFHNIIYNNKGLLNFLEKEEFNNDELRKADAYLYNEKFVQAISPYFAHSFNSISGKLLRQNDFDGLLRLVDFQGYILPEHAGEAYQKIRTYLDELNYTLRNLSWEKFIADEGILHFVFSNEWKRFINKLPSAFTSLRDELVEQLTGIVLRFQHKATWHYLHQVLVQLKAIETNDFNRSEVIRIDEVIYKNSRIEGGKGVKRKSDNEVSSGRVIWWAIWIILTIVRIATCNNRSSNNYSSYLEKYLEDTKRLQPNSSSSRAIERNNEKNLLLFLDSLSHKSKNKITPLPQAIKTGEQPFSSFADLPYGSGSYTLTITNTTQHDCVLIYFDGPSRSGSVYQGSISHISSVYIKKGDTYKLSGVAPGIGNFHFLFGEEWGRLQKEGVLSLPNYNNYNINPNLFVYEFFKPDRSLVQKYLQTGIWLEYPSDSHYEDSLYLNKPKTSSGYAVRLVLNEKNKSFSIKATGDLAVREQPGQSAYLTEPPPPLEYIRNR